MPNIIVVVGATGRQGGSVVSALLNDKNYKIRGITRNVGDLNDEDSILRAFKGAYAIYAVTNFFEPFSEHGPVEAMKVEQRLGENLARAASKTPTLKHYIWSTLPNASGISNGKYVIPHFEGKNRVDSFIQKDGVLLPKTTFLWNTYYASNLLFPLFKPNYLKTSGTYVWLQPTPSTTPIVAVGDQNENVGHFVAAVLKQPELTLPGKFVLASTETLSQGELLKLWSEVTGKKAEYIEISLEDYDRLWPMWGLEMGTMLKFWEAFGEESWTGYDVVAHEQLGIKDKLVGVKEAFASLDWSDV